MNKTDLEKLVNIRIIEADVLLSSGKYPGAYYLVGYALECALKVCIAKRVKEYDFPDKDLAYASYSHKPLELIEAAGLKQKLLKKEKEDEDFSVNWAVAKDWKETSRYECNIEETSARDLYDAITDKNSGVLSWLKMYW